MDRRSLIRLSVGAAVAAQFGPGPVLARQRIAPGVPFDRAGDQFKLGWEDFLARASATANELVADRSQAGQDAYLHGIAQHAVQLGELPEVNPRDFGDLEPGYSLDLIHRGDGPFIILYWKMAPGAIFPAHCHPVANVCTLCTSGQAMIRNFNTVEGAPACWSESDESFDVIETNAEILQPGVINTATEYRSNIHRFEAGPQGAEGIDITTGYEAAKPFSYLQLWNPTVGPSGERRLRGRWVGKNLKSAVHIGTAARSEP